MSGLICIQSVWHPSGIPERTSQKVILKKISRRQKSWTFTQQPAYLTLMTCNILHWPQCFDKTRYGCNIAWKIEQSAITDRKDHYFKYIALSHQVLGILIGQWLLLWYVKGVKKVRSAVHYKISNHLKKKWCWKIAFTTSLLYLVMLFSVWHPVWHKCLHTIIITLGTVFQLFQKNLIFS